MARHPYAEFLFKKVPRAMFLTRGGRIATAGGVIGLGGAYLLRRGRENIGERWVDPMKYDIYRNTRMLRRQQEQAMVNARKPQVIRGFFRRYPAGANGGSRQQDRDLYPELYY